MQRNDGLFLLLLCQYKYYYYLLTYLLTYCMSISLTLVGKMTLAELRAYTRFTAEGPLNPDPMGLERLLGRS